MGEVNMNVRNLLLIFIVPSILFSQVNTHSNLALNFYMGIPQGEFRQNVDRLGFGLNVEYLYKPSPIYPFSIGFNLGFLNYGSLTRKEPFSYTIPDVTVDVTNQNNIINYHLLFQIGRPTGNLRPYIQGYFGGAYIYTQTKITNQSTSEEIASSVNFEDNAWSYGVGAGIAIKIYSTKMQEPTSSKINDIFLNIKVNYLYGSEAEYLKEGSIRYLGNGKVAYDVLKSKTDLLGIHLGIIMEF